MKKLRIRLVSDLHRDVNRAKSLESVIKSSNSCKDDVLLLAGDFINGAFFNERLDRKYLFDELEALSEKYRKVIYIFGNHEHYGGRPINETINKFRQIYHADKKITFLENESIFFPEENVHIFAGTMWAQMFRISSEHQELIIDAISDFRTIHQWTSSESDVKYAEFIYRLQLFLNQLEVEDTNRRVVILSHFAPFQGSVHFKYHGNPINPYFANDLDLAERYRRKINYWFHGHTHSSFEYEHMGIKVACNPYGYGYENKDYKKNFTIEI